MKKLFAVLVVLTLVVGAVFADVASGISIQAWGRGVLMPILYDGSDAYAGTGITWSSGKPRVDYRINGATDYVGFAVHSNAEDFKISDGDNGAHIWIKPFSNDMLKLTVGTFIEDELRGKIAGNGHFSSFVLGKGGDEDAIFMRFGASTNSWGQSYKGGADIAFMLSSTPADGLFFGLLVPGNFNSTLASDAYQNMQLGLGYKIEGIGHIRAQYIGNTADPKEIGVAFALSSIDNLLIDLGSKIFIGGDIDVNIAVGFNFRADAIGIGGRIDVNGLTSDLEFILHLIPTIALDSATVGLDLGFAMSDANYLGFGLWVQKGLAGGNIKAGAAYELGADFSGGVLRVPVIFEYAFF